MTQKRKKTIDEEKHYDSNELESEKLYEAEKLVSTVLSEKNIDSPRAKYFLFRILGLSPQIAAKACDYHPDYGYKLDKKFRNDHNLRSLAEKITGSIPEQYKALCKLRLVDVAEIETRALAEYKDNPKLAIDKPQLLKQVKQGAGVVGDDDSRPLNVVNIAQIQAIVHQKHVESRKLERQQTPSIIEPENRLIEE
jgi:hypothetical protein